MYKKYIKRILDFILSVFIVVLISPIIILLIVIGFIAMKGNPFFVQTRTGYKEKNFRLIKFRTMSNAKDKNGKFLSNEARLNKYGKILRSTSLDELPELFNILMGDMSLVGPRPLLPEYIEYYTEEEHHRHDVRPGLTGLAQVNGRNAISSWDERFKYDLEYIEECTFFIDIKIIVMTVLKVLKRTDVLSGSDVVVGRLDEVRKGIVDNEEERI